MKRLVYWIQSRIACIAASIRLRKSRGSRPDIAIESLSGDECSQNITADGFKAIASVGPKKGPLPEPTNEIVMTKKAHRNAKFECDHVGPKWFYLNIFGIDTRKITETRYCPACAIAYLRESTIHCGKCGLPISTGEGVCLSHVDSPDLKYKDIGKMAGPKSVICCLRWDCCDSGISYVGHWMGDVIQPAFPDGMTLGGHACESGKMVIHNM